MKKPKIHPPGLAALNVKYGAEKYCPSNGTEGEIFMSAWCHRCARWEDNGCDIAAATMFYDVDDSEYPDEWRYGDDGQPECTAFAAKPAPERDSRTLDMFSETAP